MKQKLILLTVLLTALSAFSTEYYVDASRPDDTGTATNWATAKKTIQAAVNLTKDSDTVWVTNGTYLLSAEISVTNAITIRSVNGPEVTIVDGCQSNRCFSLSGECLVSGFTVQNGIVPSNGDGGAGILCSSTNPIVLGCLIFNNGTLEWPYCYYGGGMCNGTARDCIFRGNFALHGSGAAGIIAVNCVFDQNKTTISSVNWDFASGGGMFGGEAYNCTFFGNFSFDGGGMFEGKAYSCVFSGNTADMSNDLCESIAHNSCSAELTHGATGSITNAPLFVDAANGDFRLQSNSPCINWGNNAFVTNATDLDGNPRIVEGTVDMGAYEYQGTVGLADSDFDGINDDWERQHGGNQNPDRGCSNGVNTIFQAYVAGLDPNDPESKFTAAVSGQTLKWNATSGRVYAVYYSTNLINGFQPLETNIPWTAGCFTDSIHNAHGQLFYKIDVKLEGAGSGNPFLPPGGGDDGGGHPSTPI